MGALWKQLQSQRPDVWRALHDRHKALITPLTQEQQKKVRGGSMQTPSLSELPCLVIGSPVDSAALGNWGHVVGGVRGAAGAAGRWPLHAVGCGYLIVLSSLCCMPSRENKARSL